MNWPAYPRLDIEDLNLDYTLEHIKAIEAYIDEYDTSKLQEEIDTINNQSIPGIQSQIDAINELMVKIENGEYTEMYESIIENTFYDYMDKYIPTIAEFVQFFLDDSGRLKVQIPKNWNFLQFDTPTDPEDTNYGHLILSY